MGRQAKRRWRLKGRAESGTFAAVPHAVMDSMAWSMCSGTAIKLLMELIGQYNGANNGDLCAAMTVLRPRGWKSDETVMYALRELRHYGLITLTRQGGLNKASLYAITWKPIDECKGKLECAPTRMASNDWKRCSEPYRRAARQKKATPQSVVIPLRRSG